MRLCLSVSTCVCVCVCVCVRVSDTGYLLHGFSSGFFRGQVQQRTMGRG